MMPNLAALDGELDKIDSTIAKDTHQLHLSSDYEHSKTPHQQEHCRMIF